MTKIQRPNESIVPPSLRYANGEVFTLRGLLEGMDSEPVMATVTDNDGEMATAELTYFGVYLDTVFLENKRGKWRWAD